MQAKLGQRCPHTQNQEWFYKSRYAYKEGYFDGTEWLKMTNRFQSLLILCTPPPYPPPFLDSTGKCPIWTIINWPGRLLKTPLLFVWIAPKNPLYLYLGCSNTHFAKLQSTLSRIQRDSLKYFETSVPRHIRVERGE